MGPGGRNKMAEKKKLRKGFTTGAASAAAAKAALETLAAWQQEGGEWNDHIPARVRIDFLCEGHIDIPVESVVCDSPTTAVARVIKDAGDDPDITHKALIGARVSWDPDAGDASLQVKISGGEGVGRVTKPGLELPVGEPAINPGPRKMIHVAVAHVQNMFPRVVGGTIGVEIFVPRGRELAEKTLNARLGILDGISILGTTGIVRPLSHDAYIATIKASIGVARAREIKDLFFTTGRRSERFAMEMFPDHGEEAFIQTGDFFKAALDAAADTGGVSRITYVVFFGKAVKMALGFPHTHAAKSELTLKKLARWTREITGDEDLTREVSEANTARHAFTLFYPKYPELMEYVGRQVVVQASAFAAPSVEIRVMILDFDGHLAFDSHLS